MASDHGEELSAADGEQETEGDKCDTCGVCDHARVGQQLFQKYERCDRGNPSEVHHTVDEEGSLLECGEQR